MIWPCSFAIAASIVSEAAIATDVGLGKFVKTFAVTVVSAIVVGIVTAPPDVYVCGPPVEVVSPVSVIAPEDAKAVAVLALPFKAPTKVVDVMEVNPVITVVVQEAIPAVVVNVPALLVPVIVTSLSKSIVTIPLLAATAAALTDIFESPLNSKSSVDKFKVNGPVESPA